MMIPEPPPRLLPVYSTPPKVGPIHSTSTRAWVSLSQDGRCLPPTETRRGLKKTSTYSSICIHTIRKYSSSTSLCPHLFPSLKALNVGASPNYSSDPFPLLLPVQLYSRSQPFVLVGLPLARFSRCSVGLGLVRGGRGPNNLLSTLYFLDSARKNGSRPQGGGNEK